MGLFHKNENQTNAQQTTSHTGPGTGTGAATGAALGHEAGGHAVTGAAVGGAAGHHHAQTHNAPGAGSDTIGTHLDYPDTQDYDNTQGLSNANQQFESGHRAYDQGMDSQISGDRTRGRGGNLAGVGAGTNGPQNTFQGDDTNQSMQPGTGMAYEGNNTQGGHRGQQTMNSQSLHQQGLQKEREGAALRNQAQELNAAEKLEQQAQSRRDRAVNLGAHPTHGHLGGSNNL